MQGRFTKVVTITAQSDAGQSLVDFTDDVGIPERLVTEGAGQFTSKGKQFCERGVSHADTVTHQQTGSEELDSCSRARDWVTCKATETPNAKEKVTKAALGLRIGGRERNTDVNGPQAESPHWI